MATRDYTLTRDELITDPKDIMRTQFGYDMLYWTFEDRTETGCYETDAQDPLCANCAIERFDIEIDETHAFYPESVEGYESGFLYCGHCGTDVTEL